MPLIKSHAPLIIIGGAEEKEGEREILRYFVDLAGAKTARIVIFTAATKLPEELGEEYQTIFRELTCTTSKDQVQVIHVRNREEAADSDALNAIALATGAFFTGGDQNRITSLIGGTKMDSLLHEKHEQGMILAGTSAGASMMSSTMILEGESETTPRLGAVRLGAGLEFLPGVIIDQHFAQRGRINRLLSAVAQYPHHLGIGIDENTALVVNDHTFEVLGKGAVSIVDAGGVTDNNFSELSEGDCLALCNVKLHILPFGYKFDLRQREPVLKRNLRDKLNTSRKKVTS